MRDEPVGRVLAVPGEGAVPEGECGVGIFASAHHLHVEGRAFSGGHRPVDARADARVTDPQVGSDPTDEVAGLELGEFLPHGRIAGEQGQERRARSDGEGAENRQRLLGQPVQLCRRERIHRLGGAQRVRQRSPPDALALAERADHLLEREQVADGTGCDEPGRRRVETRADLERRTHALGRIEPLEIDGRRAAERPVRVQCGHAHREAHAPTGEPAQDETQEGLRQRVEDIGVVEVEVLDPGGERPVADHPQGGGEDRDPRARQRLLRGVDRHGDDTHPALLRGGAQHRRFPGPRFSLHDDVLAGTQEGTSWSMSVRRLSTVITDPSCRRILHLRCTSRPGGPQQCGSWSMRVGDPVLPVILTGLRRQERPCAGVHAILPWTPTGRWNGARCSIPRAGIRRRVRSSCGEPHTAARGDRRSPGRLARRPGGSPLGPIIGPRGQRPRTAVRPRIHRTRGLTFHHSRIHPAIWATR